MAVTGLNHVTLAVADLERSLSFYQDVLGFVVKAVWPEGAYLEAGTLWVCLSVDEATRSIPHPDYTHVAFSVSEESFVSLADRLKTSARIWKQNHSEGQSVYFLDPDGHKLEIHLGSLRTRLEHYRSRSQTNVQIFE